MASVVVVVELVVELVVDEVVVLVEVSGVTSVTGKSLVSMILVLAIEELRNFEVILLTWCALTLVTFGIAVAISVADEIVVGRGVIGILLITVVDFGCAISVVLKVELPKGTHAKKKNQEKNDEFWVYF